MPMQYRVKLDRIVNLLIPIQLPSGRINENEDHNVTLIWGVNIIASVIGSVLTVISSMVVGLNNTLLVGMGFYIGAFGTMLVILYVRHD